MLLDADGGDGRHHLACMQLPSEFFCFLLDVLFHVHVRSGAKAELDVDVDVAIWIRKVFAPLDLKGFRIFWI